MSSDPTVYIGPYVEIKTSKPAKHVEEIFGGEEPFFDCTDKMTCNPGEGVRILIPNLSRNASRQFWINPNDFVGFHTFNDAAEIEKEVEWLTTAFEAEFKKLREYYTAPDEGTARWGFFMFEL